MTREEVEKLEAEAARVLKDCSERFIEAMTLYIRMKVQKDMLFIDTGDKTLVDR